MNRRDFLRFMLGTAVAATVDVEKLLWVPGERTIFLPTEIKPIWAGSIVAEAWEKYVGEMPTDNIFGEFWLLDKLGDLKPGEVVGSIIKVPLIIAPNNANRRRS